MTLGAKAHAGNLESECERGGGGGGRGRGNSWRRQVWLPRKMKILARSHKATDIKGDTAVVSQRNSPQEGQGHLQAWFCSGQSLRGCPVEILYTKRNPLQDLGLEFPLIRRPPCPKSKSAFNVVTKQSFSRLNSGPRGMSYRMYIHSNNKTIPLKAKSFCGNTPTYKEAKFWT